MSQQARRMVVCVVWFAVGVLLVWRGTHAQEFGGQGSDLLVPEFIISRVTKDTNIHVSGTFTCDSSKDCYTEGEPVPIIEIRGRGRLMNEATGELQFFELTLSKGIVATDGDQLGGKPTRVAFSATIDLNQYLEQESIRSFSLIIDAFTPAKEGKQIDNRSLGSFSGVALSDMNGDGLVVIAVHLLPQRDSNLQLAQ